jgi:LuxR family maltose regulon positive regulatory protein
MKVAKAQPFGDILRAYRVAAGLSQEELAERAHLSRRTISDLERGVTTAPYRDTLALLAEALQLGDGDRTALEDTVQRARPLSGPHQATDRATVDPLLATKLAIPSVRGGLVERPRLLERLHAGLQRPLTLISAPAGSGKTRLLGTWCAGPKGQAHASAWVSLDEADNDPARFWTYVLTALNRAAPGVGTDVLARLHAGDAPSMEAVLGTLINALSMREEDIVLILDDYHLIEAEPIHRMLAFLIEHLPPCLHLLLAGRADPPLPLARLRARGEVTELRAADLRFNAEESAAFLSRVMGLSLSPDDLAALETRTEGWIAGLQLAGLSLQGRSAEEAAAFITAFTGSHRYIVDYLLDEVLLRQPDHVQRFLLHTCVLTRLCSPLCAAVLAGENPSPDQVSACREVIEALERNNVFLIALDDERRWYRYHYLFADAVRLRQSGDATIPDRAELHHRAGVWFEQHNLLDEAIDHMLAAGRPDQAAALIGRRASVLTARGEVATVTAWLRVLPEAVLAVQPQLCLLYAWVLIDMRDLQGAERYLQHAEAASATQSAGAVYPASNSRQSAQYTTNIRAVIAAGRAIISVIQGDAERAISQASAALEDVAETDVRARSVASIALGLAYLSRGPVQEAGEAFRQVAIANRATSFVLFRVLATVGEECAHRMAGDLDAALAGLDQAIQWSREHDLASLLDGSLYTGTADILRERNDPAGALDRVTEGLRLSGQLGAGRDERWIEWHMCDLLVLARIKQAGNDPDGALAVVHEARDRLKGLGVSSFTAILAAFEAQIRVSQGDIEPAVHWLRSVESHAVPPRFGLTPRFFIYASEHLEIAPVQVLLAQGRSTGNLGPMRQVLALLDEPQGRAARIGMVWLHAKSLALRALAHQMLGESASALTALDRALVLAQPGGHVRLFIDEGPAMAELLRQLDGRCSVPDYLANLLTGQLPGPYNEDTWKGGTVGDTAVGVEYPLGRSRPVATNESVTERELEVLRLLAVGQSNPEIARTLYVEVNTIKTHIKSLYGKLGVHGRVQAVQRAREIGLL